MGCIHSTNRKLEHSTLQNTPTFILPTAKMKCKVLKVYDGDTIWVSIILHNNIVKFNCRMIGYDSPEMKPPLSNKNRHLEKNAAIAARDYLSNLILHKIVDIQFGNFDKYGRALCSIYINDPDSYRIVCKNKVCVNTIMIREGHGYPYLGGHKKSFKKSFKKPVINK